MHLKASPDGVADAVIEAWNRTGQDARDSTDRKSYGFEFAAGV